ncbi:MAG: efflux RND transporter permease subunit, partial [Gemmatimonadetes bacterium]|nr:efflux RND transporter permease subunit [Gemmatimonadota bacterium]
VAIAVALMATQGLQPFGQTTVNGLVSASYFALGAVGLTLVYGTLKLVNFAHGDLLTLGAYVAFVANVSMGLPILVAVLGAVVGVAGFGVASERVMWRPMRAKGAGLLQLLIMAVGLAFVIRYTIQLFAGTQPRSLDVDITSSTSFIGLTIGQTQLIVVIVGFTVLLAVGAMLRFTSLGRQMRALADNFELAEVAGIDTDRVVLATWIFAAGLAGLAGVLYTSAIGNMTPNLGFFLLLSLFAAVILGGMLFLAVVLLGAISFTRLPVDLLPDVSYPRLVVYTSYPDVAPSEVERLVTERVEAEAAAVPGVERVTSVSREGVSLVTLRFAWGTDMDFAMLGVRERLDNLRDALPESATRPRILRVDPESEPVMALSVAGAGDLWRTKELAETVFRRRLEQLDGVARAAVTGGLDREIQVEVDPERLRAYGLTLADVAEALEGANVSAPGGTILQGRYRYPLRTLGEFVTVEEMGGVVLERGAAAGDTATSARGTVRLSDVARVVDGFADRQAIARMDGVEAVGLLVFKESGANTVAVAEAVEGVLEQLRLEYPSVSVAVASSQAGFIAESIANVVQALVLGGLLAFLVLGSVAWTQRRVRWAVRGLVLGAFVVCLAGLVTRLLPEVWPLAPDLATGRLSFPVTYWNALGLVAVLGMIAAFSMSSDAEEPPLGRILGAAALPVLATALLLTFSRGAILAGAAGLLVAVAAGRSRGLLAALLVGVPSV